MFDVLDKLFPPEIVGLILCFDPRIYNEFVRDFIETVYVRAYRRCFRDFTFKRCLARTQTLTYYAVICQALRATSPHEIKKSRTMRHRMPYKDAIVKYRLHKQFTHMLDQAVSRKTRLFGSFYNQNSVLFLENLFPEY